MAGCPAWAAGQRSGALAQLDRLAGVLTTVRAALLVAEQAAVQTAAGDRDYAATRARITRTGLGEVRREVRQAETIQSLPAVGAAVGGGDMPVAHLDALARITAGASERARSGVTADDVRATLVRWARRQTLKEFTASVQRLVASLDPAGLERTAQAQHAARFLHLTHHPDGTLVRARLDRFAGQTLRFALDSTNQAPDEDRSKEQADADALIALAERALSGMAGIAARQTVGQGGDGDDAGQSAADARVSGTANRPTLSILVPAETSAAIRAHQRAAAEHAAGPVDPATLDGAPIAMSELARLLCDCEIGRVVLDADSVPLDLGRTTRLFTAAQRRAVIIRDRACTWNGCDVPAAYCEVHHIRWWDRDPGASDLDNAALLCTHHHHVVHQHDLDIIRLSRTVEGGGSRRPRGRPCGGLGEHLCYFFSTRTGRTINAPPGEVPRTAGPESTDGPDASAAVILLDVDRATDGRTAASAGSSA